MKNAEMTLGELNQASHALSIMTCSEADLLLGLGKITRIESGSPIDTESEVPYGYCV